MLDSSVFSLTSCTSRVWLYPRNLRTEGAGSSLPCISVYGSIHHLVPSALVMCLPCPLALYVHRPLFSPRFVCSAFSATAIFPYYLPHARRDAPCFAKPSPVTRFLYFRRVHRDARDRSCERGDLGLRNAKIFPTYTRRFGREREATSWDSSSTKRRISNYDLLLLALLFAPPPSLICFRMYEQRFARISLGFLSVGLALRMFLCKRSG